MEIKARARIKRCKSHRKSLQNLERVRNKIQNIVLKVNRKKVNHHSENQTKARTKRIRICNKPHTISNPVTSIISSVLKLMLWVLFLRRITISTLHYSFHSQIRWWLTTSHLGPNKISNQTERAIIHQLVRNRGLYKIKQSNRKLIDHQNILLR